MPKVKYVGPAAAVDVPDAGLKDVPRGEAVNVKDSIAKRMLEQDVWESVPEPAPKPKPKKKGNS